MAMFEAIRKIRQTYRNIRIRCRKIRNEMQRQRIISEMEEAGIIIIGRG